MYVSRTDYADVKRYLNAEQHEFYGEEAEIY